MNANTSAIREYKVGEEIRIPTQGGAAEFWGDSHLVRIDRVKRQFGEQWIQFTNGYKWHRASNVSAVEIKR